MLKSLTVDRMFGRPDYSKTVRFNPDLTVLIGSNGSGKTTTMNILSHLLRKRFQLLKKIKFSKVTLEMSSGVIMAYPVSDKLVVTYFDAAERVANELERRGIKPDETVMAHMNAVFSKGLSEELLPQEFREVVSMYHVTVENNQDPDTIYDSFVLSESSLYFPTFRRFEMDLRDILRESIGLDDAYVHMAISRTYGRQRSKNGMVIGVTNEDVIRILKDAMSSIHERSTQRLNKLIKDYTLSLFHVAHSDSKVPKSFKEVETTVIEGFRKAGLIDSGQDQVIKEFTETVREAVKLFPKKGGMKQFEPRHLEAIALFGKLRRFADLYEAAAQDLADIQRPLTLVVSTLREFLGKECIVQEDGTFLCPVHGSPLTVEALSAGEKQLVSLFIYIGLSSGNESVILIDEPELSLNVGWQRKLLETLSTLAMGKQLIISTHSPSIVGKFREKVEVMGEEEQ